MTTCSDGACPINNSTECIKRSTIQAFWHFVRKHNAEVAMRYDRLYIILSGCNLDAFCAEYGKQIINCKIMDDMLHVEVRGVIGENLTQDEIIAACGDWQIRGKHSQAVRILEILDEKEQPKE